jgi:hypothetical protein
MVRITVPADLERALGDLKSAVELCTDDGRVLGQFIPRGPFFLTVDDARRLNLCPFSEEELQEAGAEPFEGRPLADILRDLEQQCAE